MRTSDNVLEIEGLSVKYGHVSAVENVTMSVGKGEVLALLGSNGAGKSSLLRAVSGLAPITAGSITLAGRPIHTMPAHRITRAGIAHVPQGRRSIGSLSVEENLLVAAHAAGRNKKSDIRAKLREVYAIFPRLEERRHQFANLMSGGEQQMLAISRGLLASPEVLLIDEPSMGLAPIMITEIYAVLGARQGPLGDVSIVLTDQSVAVALPLADHVHILSRGQTAFDGPPNQLSEEATKSAYLGS